MLFEDKFIYFPDKYPEGDWSPSEHAVSGLGIYPRIKDCYLTTSDGVKLHGWHCQPATAVGGSDRATILWFHGNAGNITHRYETIVSLLESPANIFIIDYRGYGRSEGKPSELGLYRDAQAAWGYLVNEYKIAPSRIVVMGRSLGGAVAIDLVSRGKLVPAGMIIESSFTSVPDMAGKVLPFMPRFLVRTKMDSVHKIGTITAPKLFVHGDSDSIVPYKQGRKLFDRAAEPKQFYTIKGADHNDTDYIGGQAYFELVAQFVRNCVSTP